MSNPGGGAQSVVIPETQVGKWDPVLTFPNVAVHTHVLPDGRVLMWGRRDHPTDTLDEHVCTPFLWDPTDPTEPTAPTTAKTIHTSKPQLADGRTTVNLFCGGHAFLPDGRLLAVGGHLQDTDGVNQASLFNVTAESADGSGTWEATELMLHGRWYPTATALPDGSVLVMAGSFLENGQPPVFHNRKPQVWLNGTWRTLADFPLDSMDLYPRAHVISDGRVFVSGTLQSTWLLDTAGDGSWEQTTADHPNGQLDYAPAVMYDVDKIVYIGGGGPTNEVETIDFGKLPLRWEPASPMKSRRRQHNATLLPDGTILVTGGSQGIGFNNLDADQPVHTAELWDPATREWTELAPENVDRCYHSTAVLLPDATVLSAGGGEFKVGDQPNPAADNHRNGQIFHPPYLFKGDRPEIASVSADRVHYGGSFEVETAEPDDIAKVSWIRLSSVTHSFNQNQRINFPKFDVVGGKLIVTAPESPNICPPGHYMLFIVNKAGVPSVATMMHIQAAQPASPAVAGPAAHRLTAGLAAAPRPAPPAQVADDPRGHQAAVVGAAQGTAVIVGITSTCPYGLGACWGGAHEALGALPGVNVVNPIANAADSTAEVFLDGNGLPPLHGWVRRFRDIVNNRYDWRGVEVTLTGALQERDGALNMAANEQRPAVQLVQLQPSTKIQWDNTTRARKPLQPDERTAYQRLAETHRGSPDAPLTVAGPLTLSDSGYQLHVRMFAIQRVDRRSR